MSDKKDVYIRTAIIFAVILAFLFGGYKAYNYFTNKPKDISNVEVGKIDVENKEDIEDDYMSFVDTLTTPPCLSTPLYNTKENLALYYKPNLDKHSKDGDIYELISNKKYGYETVYNSNKYELMKIDNNDKGAVYLKPKEREDQRGSIYIDVIEEGSVSPKDIYRTNINRWKDNATIVNKAGKYYDIFSVDKLTNEDIEIKYKEEDIKYVTVGKSYYEVSKDIDNNTAQPAKKLHYIETPIYDIKIVGSIEDTLPKTTAVKQYLTLMMDKVFVFTVVSPDPKDTSYEKEVEYMIDNLTYYNQMKDVEVEQSNVYESSLMKYKVPKSYMLSGTNDKKQATFERNADTRAGKSIIIEKSLEVSPNNEYALNFLNNEDYVQEVMLMAGILSNERLSRVKLTEYTKTESVRHGKKDSKIEFFIRGDEGMLPLHGIGYAIYDSNGILHTITILTENNNDFIANREIDNIINSLSLKVN